MTVYVCLYVCLHLFFLSTLPYFTHHPYVFISCVTHRYDTLSLLPDMDYDSDGGIGAQYIRWASRFYIVMLAHAHDNAMLPAMTASLVRLFSENIPAARIFLEHCADNIETVTVPILHCTRPVELPTL